MKSETQDFVVELEAYDAHKSCPRSFELYEEYSKRNIADTIRTRRQNFSKADLKAKRKLEANVEKEIESFRVWLRDTKNLEQRAAHYYAVSLKSLFLGLPIGVQVACLFDIMLDTWTEG
jgi:hypothetical protein